MPVQIKIDTGKLGVHSDSLKIKIMFSSINWIVFRINVPTLINTYYY